ncbi:MAG TPA: SDR family NAD(P)-dependent oxidoreductase, partial [bacterium]|nr:SDR family NAD(P)-dependent oxidoreductase [bacterium]
MEISLQGKVAIITGSIQGIGRATAEMLAANGAAVVLNNHENPTQLEEVVAGIRAKGGRAQGIIADVTKREEAQKLVDAALALGRI